MRFIVFSDAHKSAINFKKTLDIHSEADGVIYLGDGEKNIIPIAEQYNKSFYFVKGNNDYFSNSKIVDFLQIENHKIMFTHGHKYNVKNNLELIKQTARDSRADILLYGHTHIPFTEFDDGLYVMNPGSISIPNYYYPTFGILDITIGGVVLIIAKALFPKQ